MQKLKNIFFALILIVCNATAQDTTSISKQAARYEIDVKRREINFDERDALLRSREFIRLDPTYYVGYLYEGVFKYEHASDAIGYRNCIPPLKKAMQLFEKEFSDKLTTHYANITEYQPLHVYISDYQLMTYNLTEAYSNLNQPDSVMILLEHYDNWHMQFDAYGAKDYMAWTVHRNRFYTKDKYSFLENSIKKNDEKALNYLYKNLSQINNGAELNEQVFSVWYVERARLSAYHYLSLIHDYEQNIDSAYYYFQKMADYGNLPYNNFAIFNYALGAFSDADSYFNISRRVETGDKRLRESEYYYSIIEVMKANPVDAIKHVNDIIRENGSTPGWGWYNIAMARSFLYNGQIDKAEQYLNKAKNFKEVHIGTTWGQSHYDSSIKFLQTEIARLKISALKFENKNYFWSPSLLVKLAQLKINSTAEQFVLLSQLAANPERERVFFTIFSSECTVSFDEILSALGNGINNKYFANLYEKYLKTDRRTHIHKYFRLFLASIYHNTGNNAKAREQLDKILHIEYIDDEYEVVFRARVYELLAKTATTEADKLANTLKMYSIYPQLVPMSDLQMRFKFDIRSSNANKTEDAIISKLNSYNIVADKNDTLPTATISFTNNGKSDVVEFKVTNANGKTIVKKTEFAYNNIDEATRRIAYGLFNVIDPVLPVDAISAPKQ